LEHGILKINGYTAPQQANQNGVNRTGGRVETTAAVSGEESTQASVSRFSNAVEASGQDIDLARVAEIRQAIADGKLAIDTSRIADGLIDSVRELLDDETP